MPDNRVPGWLSSVSWLAGTAAAMFLSGSAMMGLIVVTQPNYVPEAYHGYLFTVMVASFALFVNTVLARYLPRLEGVVFVLFIIAFMATLVVLWVLAPRLSAGGKRDAHGDDSSLIVRAAEVFGTITKGEGWSSLGLSLLVSQSAIMFLIVGE